MRHLLAIAFALVACDSSEPTEPAPPAARPTIARQPITKELCECKTLGCADRVIHALSVEPIRARRLGAEAGECYSKALTESRVPTLAGFRDWMCECKDAACADVVSHYVTSYVEQEQHKYRNTTLDASSLDLHASLGTCMQRAMTAGGHAAL